MKPENGSVKHTRILKGETPVGFEKIFENTYVCDEGHVRFFLLTGEKKALLVDSGMETKNVRALAEEVTDLPLALFNTHTDRDHTGGNGEFGQIMLNPAELVNYASPHPSSEILPVFDGDELDLGNRPLKAIALPGHTPGSTALLDIRTGALFSGDPIQKDGRIFMFGPMRDLSAYILSLKRLLTFTDQIRQIYPCHGAYPLSMDIVPALIEGAEKIERGELSPGEGELFGRKIAVYHAGCSTFLCDL